MKNKYLMAIDAGTGSVRSVIFNTKGNQISIAQREWFHTEDLRYPGSMNFDWDVNWQLALDCINESISKANIDGTDILAISTSSMREGIVLYDKQRNEIWACANVDARSSKEVKELINMDCNFEKQVYNLSGQTYALSAIPRLLWVKNNEPDIYNKIAYLSMFNDWLIYKLSGIISSEPSNACTTGIFNLNSRDWESDILKKLDLKYDIFPKMYECGQIIGNISKSISDVSLLSTKTKLVAGGGDAQLGCIGVGLVNNDEAAVFGGSFWQYEYNTKHCVSDSNYKLRLNCHAIDNMWQYEAIAFMPGLAMRWFKDSFCTDEIAEAKKLGISAYDVLSEKAQHIPAGCYGMLCTFSDVMNYISWKHAAPSFINFSFDSEKFNKYSFYKSIMENACLVTKGHLDLVESTIGKRPKSIIFASGASQSNMWCQILADVLNVEVKVPKVKEASALGAAMLAGLGVGLFGNINEAAEMFVKIEKHYLPKTENTAIYEEMYKRWREVYKTQLSLCDNGLCNYMWAAPGTERN